MTLILFHAYTVIATIVLVNTLKVNVLLKLLLSISLSSFKRCPACATPFAEENLIPNEALAKTLEQSYTVSKCGMPILTKELGVHESACKECQKALQTTIQKLVKPAPEGYINRSTFACPFCKTTNMTQKTIVSHIKAKHRGKPGV